LAGRTLGLASICVGGISGGFQTAISGSTLTLLVIQTKVELKSLISLLHNFVDAEKK